MKVLMADRLTWSDLESKVKDENDWKAFVCGLSSEWWRQINPFLWYKSNFAPDS